MSRENRFVLKHAMDALLSGWFHTEGSEKVTDPDEFHAVQNRGRYRSGYIIIDAIFVCLNAVVIYSLRFGTDWIARLPWIGGADAPISSFHVQDPYVAFLLVYITLILLALERRELYRVSPVGTNLDEAIEVLKAVALATLVLTAFIYLSNVKTISRLVVLATGLLNVITLATWRIWRREVVKRRVSNEKGGRNALIVGIGKTGQALARYLTTRKDLGYVFKGFLDGNHPIDSRVLGHIEDLPRIVKSEFVDDIFITVPSEQEAVKSALLEARRNRLGVTLVPELFDAFGQQAPLQYLGDFPVIELQHRFIPEVGLFVKRGADAFLAFAGLVLLSPLFAIISIAIKLDDPGPALYRAPRIGKKGKEFICYKFRSMVADADLRKEDLRDLNERSGPFFKISNDPRLTRVGKLLRKFSLDELPQLWNVLKGDMSMVGPRPHPTDDYKQYQLEHLRRLDATPGITGLWQVSARRDPSFEENLRLDLEYIENWNLWLDLKILLKTVPTVLSGSGQ